MAADDRFPPPIAGHHLALLAQLRAAGWSVEDREAVGHTYRLALALSTGQYRANGKSLLDHFVGTASVLVSLGERRALVLAALVHNAYRHGLWASGRPGAGRRRRQELRVVIGEEAEDLVFGYESFDWWEDDIADVLARVDALTPLERDLTVLRLANEVEDRSQWGLLLSRQHRRPLPPMIELAGRLGHPDLARWLAALQAEEAVADPEPGLVAAGHGVEVIPPRSHRRRLRPFVHDTYRATRRRLRPLRRRFRR